MTVAEVYRMQWRGLHRMTERGLRDTVRDACEMFGHRVYVWEDTDRSGASVTLTRIDARESGQSLELLITCH